MPYQISDLAQATDVIASLASREMELGGLGLNAWRLSIGNLRKALLLGSAALGFSTTDPATVGALSATTGAFSALVSVSYNSAEIRLSGSATNQYIKLSAYDNGVTDMGEVAYAGSNSASNRYFGIILPGTSTADFLMLGTFVAKPVEVFTNGTLAMTVATNQAVTFASSIASTIASFTLNQNAATTITITNTDATNTASRAQLSIVGGGHNGLFSSIATDGIYIGATTSSVVRFISSGAEKFRLNTDGTVTFGSSIVVSAGPLLVGTTVSTGAAAGNVVVPNGSTYAAVNGAGTSVLGLIDLDASNRTRLQLNSAALALNNPSTAASATAGGATALPANPVGYLILTLNGATNKIPYYAN